MRGKPRASHTRLQSVRAPAQARGLPRIFVVIIHNIKVKGSVPIIDSQGISVSPRLKARNLKIEYPGANYLKVAENRN